MADASAVAVRESFVSAAYAGEELDSLATWPTVEGGLWVIATAKASHRLKVFDGDTGRWLRDVGGRGTEPGQFNRPNGIAVHGDLLFVVERDNRRVQVLSLPGFEPVGQFGHAELQSPYGLWLHETAPGELEVFVTDSFMLGERFDVVPPWSQLDQRVRRYRVSLDGAGRLAAHPAGSFGSTQPDTALRMVESIAGDPATGRLLVADEDRRHRSTLYEYRLDGSATGRRLPGAGFGAEAEGIALWSCPDDGGYWVAVDQLMPLAQFHLFQRGDLTPAGSFRGETVSYTDGIALHAAPTRAFPGGVLYAVHADSAVAAFDLRGVVDGLDLDRGCVE
ncbi:phytase [Lysobacter sp. A3-1-A15]|uniref:phytase n=1 Tax=Novilysobacter viscosus TaxID=3098602 RepID=UPI002ED86234